MTASDQPTPQPAHALGSLTTTELSRYRKDLERALSDRTIGRAPVAESIKAKLAAVLEEEVAREAIRNTPRTWPATN